MGSKPTPYTASGRAPASELNPGGLYCKPADDSQLGEVTHSHDARDDICKRGREQSRSSGRPCELRAGSMTV